MRTASLISAFGIVALAALSGCTETLDSDLIKTKGIAATVEVSADSETSTRVHVVLQAGGDESNTYIELQSGDTLYASADDERKSMDRVDEGEYDADFGTGLGGTEFVVDFQRADDTSAPNSRGILPDAFTLDAIEDDLSRATDDLVITWDGGDSSGMNIVLDGSCIYQFDEDVSDTGSYTIKAGEIESTGQDNPEDCELTATLTRSTSGSPDPAFDAESDVVLRQIRSTSFASKP